MIDLIIPGYIANPRSAPEGELQMNNDAKVRENCNITYKKVLCFSATSGELGTIYYRCRFSQPNHGNGTKEAVTRLVKLIRCRFDENVPIIPNADSRFLSDENLLFFENEHKANTCGIVH